MGQIDIKQIAKRGLSNNYTQTGSAGLAADLEGMDNALANVSVPSRDNKGHAASATTSDGDQAMSATIYNTPAGNGYVEVEVNGAHAELGNGVKSKDCYFSNDSGATARYIVDIAEGDTLHWNGSIAGYQLSILDRISLFYNGPSSISDFSASTVTGMRLWLKADDLALSDGAAVGTWADASGEGTDFTQATASKKPTFKTGIIGGMPVVRFDNVDDVLVNTTADWRSSDTSYTLFSVMLSSSVDTNMIWFESANDGDATTLIWTHYATIDPGGGGKRVAFLVAGPAYTDNATTDIIDGFPHICVTQHNSTLSPPASRDWRLDGSDESNGSTGNVGGPAAVSGRDNIALGGIKRLAGEIANYEGDIAEVIYYDSALSLSDIIKVETYLSAKYGIAIP